MTFTRTSAGKIAAFRFFTSPLVWVEGPEDVEMFSPLARQYGCIFKSADGKNECAKLIQALTAHDHAYAVIIDGDYTILSPAVRSHRRVIRLRRYSAENYLYEEAAVRHFCLAILRYQGDPDPFATTMSDLSAAFERELKELITLDIARELSGSAVAVLPHRIDALFKSNNSIDLSIPAIQQRVNYSHQTLDNQAKAQARQLLDNFLVHSRFVDVMNGHLILGAIRRILSVLSRRAGTHFPADDRMLRISLAGMVWHRRTSSEHRRVMDRVRTAVTEIRRVRWPVVP